MIFISTDTANLISLIKLWFILAYFFFWVRISSDQQEKMNIEKIEILNEKFCVLLILKTTQHKQVTITDKRDTSEMWGEEREKNTNEPKPNRIKKLLTNREKNV